MGVRRVYTFVAQKFKGWKTTQFQPGTRLVIDGSICNSLYSDYVIHKLGPNYFCKYLDYLLLHLGDYPGYFDWVSQFIQALLSAGVIPLVLFNGISVSRADDQDASQQKHNNVITWRAGTHTGRRCTIFNVAFAQVTMIEVLKKLKVEYYVADSDADVCIAGEAIALNCPVLGDESDFYIYPLPAGYIPYYSLVWRSQPLEAKVYYHDVFAEEYKIVDPKLLLLLPAIIGNNTIYSVYEFGKYSIKDSQCFKVLQRGVLALLIDVNCGDIESVLKFASKFESYESCLKSLLQEMPLLDNCLHPLYSNLTEAYREYYTCAFQYAKLGQDVKYHTTSLCSVDGTSIPGFILKHFRDGMLLRFHLQLICTGDAFLQRLPEALEHPFCHDIGIPIRNLNYNVLCDDHTVFECRRSVGSLYQEWQPISPSKECSIMNENFVLPGLRCTQEYDKSCSVKILYGILECEERQFSMCEFQDMKLILAITRYWYNHCRTDLDKDKLLQAFLLSLMKHVLEDGASDQMSSLTERNVSAFRTIPFIYAFSQWLVVYMDISNLNRCLLEPVQLIEPSQFFNAISLYNTLSDIGKAGLHHVLSQAGVCVITFDIMYVLITE